MNTATLEVPTELIEAFKRETRSKAKCYAEGSADEIRIWGKRIEEGREIEDGRVDVDRHLALSTAALELAEQTGEVNGELVRFTGSAWVLSDVADNMLIAMIDEARNVA